MSSRAAFPALVFLALGAPLAATPYPAAPYGYVSTPFSPPENTFYYHDFNAYALDTSYYSLSADALVGDGRGGGFSMVNPRTSSVAQNRSTLELVIGYGGSGATSTRNSTYDPDRSLGNRGPDYGPEEFNGLTIGVTASVLRFRQSSFKWTGAQPSGVGFAVSTVGYSALRLAFDFAQSSAGDCKYFVIRASADGGATWPWSETVDNVGTDTWYNDFVFDLSSVPALEDNADVVFQILASPNPDTGVWESSDGTPLDNGASFAIDRVMVSGTLLPPPTYTPLEEWRILHFGQSEGTGEAADAADPDGDGVPNLLEYALGGLPRDGASAPRPALSVEDDKLRLSFVRADDAALRYEVEASTDLADPDGWSRVWLSEGAQNVAGLVSALDSETLAAYPRRFLRLRVSFAP